ncbi:piggyBac transposable element-derived protein 3-like [Culex pipiens pallens]|uniref:piggyBac transposable element-derived protein 3-like n=1 Tax=Culex pipiens pallens TaxID=42434 RepID=UPI00195388C6|nr:piggyBac transposable element-derived protein 3-like [Culex pipiens pallens]
MTNLKMKIVIRKQDLNLKMALLIPTVTNAIQILTMIREMNTNLLVMCYNRLPAMRMYWSKKPALENLLIKQTMTRDRFKLLYSKLYFNTPQKPPNAGKLYYLEKVIPMFNTSFQRVRSNSTFQSIDEMMTKCKGRVGFKQYNPMKPIKRGIKQWDRADSVTGYVYDMQVYFGKGEQKDPDRTLGESVVLKSLSSIPKRELKNVSVCFDRFFNRELVQGVEMLCHRHDSTKSKKPTHDGR